MKKEFLKKLHTHMFDGEGGDGGAAAGTPQDGGAESTAEPTVVYGKAEAEGDDAGQVGTDEGEPGEDAQEGATDPEAEFNELINGQYKDQFDAHVKNIMSQRFKNTEDYQETISSYDKAVAPLYAIYGIRPGDVQGLERAIASDDSLYASRADEAGLTAQQYRENLRLRMEAEQGRSLQEEMRRQAERQKTFDRWDSEARELKDTFPAFDLQRELNNEDFLAKLNAGYSVRDAFMTAHMSDILSGAMGEVKSATTQKVVENIHTRQARPSENAARTQQAVVRKADPSHWTDEDFDEVERRVQNGERIVL